MRKSVWLWVSAGVAVLLLVLVGLLLREGGRDVVEVGAILPLTGPAAHIGNWQRKGIELAVERVNSQGGIAGKKLVVVFEDSQGDPKTGVSAFHKIAATEERCPVVLCSLTSVSSAVIPLADREQKVLMMLAVSLPGITERSDWAFRCNLGSDDEAVAMARHLRETAARRVCLAYINNEFGLGAVTVFKSLFKEGGGKVVAEESYEEDWTNFRTMLTKFKAADPEGVYVIGYVKASVLLIKQMRELGIEVPVFANMALSIPSHIEMGGDALEGTTFTVTRYDPDSRDLQTSSFVSAYTQAHGEKPTFFAAFAYDAVGLVASAARENGTEPNDVRLGLVGTKVFEGVMGQIRVKPNGDIDFPTRVVRVRGGQVQPVPEKP